MKTENSTTMIYKALHKKLKDEIIEPPLKQGWAQVFKKGCQFMYN